MILKAKIDKDLKTLEFLLKTIPEDAIPLLFGKLEWKYEYNESAEASLSKKRFIDRLFYGMRRFESESDFDYLFELYVNEKFSLPDNLKQRLFNFSYWLAGSKEGEIKQLIQNTNLNMLFGELKPTFVSANFKVYGTIY